MIDVDLAERFVELLMGRPDTVVCIQWFDDSMVRADAKRAGYRTGTIKQHAKQLSKVNDDGCGVFIQVNGSKRGKAGVTEARAVFADDDALSEEQQIEEAAKLGRAATPCARCGKLHDGSFPPLITVPPTIIVQSSASERNKHYYWRLTDPMTDLERWSDVQWRISCSLRTDPSMKNVDRVMRLPGTMNRKVNPKRDRDGTPFLVKIVESDSNRRYTVDGNFLIEFPEPPSVFFVASKANGASGANGTSTTSTAAMGAEIVFELPPLEDMEAGAMSLAARSEIIVDFTAGTIGLADGTPLAIPGAPSTGPSPKIVDEKALRTAGRIREWLARQQVEYDRRKHKRNPLQFVLRRCVFNPEHSDKLAIIVHPESGAIWAGCFHTTCGSNSQRWDEISAKIGGWGVAEPGAFRYGSQTEVAVRLLRDLAVGTPEEIVAAEGALWRYSPLSGIWNAIDEAVVSRVVQTYDGRKIGENGKRLLVGTREVNGAFRVASQRVAQPDFFDDHAPGLVFTNGFVTVDTQGVHVVPFSPLHRAIASMPFAYDPGAPRSRFERFLDEVFMPDEDARLKKQLAQECVGAALMGLATRYECGVFLMGEGANGKSVFLKVIKALFPPGTTSAVRPQDFDKEYYRAALVGSRLNIVAEVSQAKLTAPEAYKSVTSGESIDAREAYGKVFTFAPIAAQWFALNGLFDPSDTSWGFWRKTVVLAFNRRFSIDEQDKMLASILIEDELPGIATWALEGARRLVEQDAYSVVASSEEQKRAWRRSTDCVMSFHDECCAEAPWGELAILDNETEINELYQHFQAWCRWTRVDRPPSRDAFSRRLTQLGFRPRKSNGRVLYPLVVQTPPPTNEYI